MDPFSEIASMANPREKENTYNEALADILDKEDVERAKGFLSHVLSDVVPLVLGRKLLSSFAEQSPKLSPEKHKEIVEDALEKLQPRIASFAEQVTILREHLANTLEKEESWSEAARVLSSIDYESGAWKSNNDGKLEKYIRIAMLYLEDTDHGNAEVFIKRAASLIGVCRDDALQLQYKFCYARILDAKRRFLEVAMRYYELSLLGKIEISGKRIKEEELEMALMASVKCTILAAPCPQRSRMLATLYKDEHTAQLPVFGFLEKVYMERILKKQEVDQFASTLDAHQLARLPDGSTVLDKAVLQHNILSASKLYFNIAIDQLASLLGVAPDKAETVAAEMIFEGRLKGYIDQVEGVVYFKDDDDDPLHRCDQRIQSVCQSVNRIVDLMDKKGMRTEVAHQGHVQGAGAST